MTRAVVVGLGAVTALGADVDQTWAGLLDGRSEVRDCPELTARGHATGMVARISPAVWTPAVDDPTRRGRELALSAARQAMRPIEGLVLAERTGVVIGTTMGESAGFERAPTTGYFDLAEAGGQVFARELARTHGLGGPVLTVGTACAAGNYAIGTAARALLRGRCDAVLAGGVEPFSELALVGFSRMRATDPQGCRPFGADRRGMSLGEGAGLLCLVREETACQLGLEVLAVIGGLGLAADAHHPTAPREDGVGMSAAMRAGLARSGIEPGAVGWVSAHGTGTPRSDAAEGLALRTVFGDPPPVSSVKGAVGHALGAATAIEAVAAVMALRTRRVPPNAGCAADEVDRDLGVDVVTAARDLPDLDWVLSCGFAFGGLNSALLLGRAA